MANLFLRGWNWCRRFRHRCGYGVHSPSDFFLITFVIYENLPYYAYRPLKTLRKNLSEYPHYREKTDKLLFRLINYLQPAFLLEAGTGSGLSACYMAEASSRMHICTLSEIRHEKVAEVLSGKANVEYICGGMAEKVRTLIALGKLPDAVHIGHTPDYKEIVGLLLPHMSSGSCMIIGEPHGNPEKYRWWKSVVSDERTGVTFDLYDVGIVFFDKARIKEHRIVNFL